MMSLAVSLVLQPEQPNYNQLHFPNYFPNKLLSHGSKACTWRDPLLTSNIVLQSHYKKGNAFFPRRNKTRWKAS